MFTTLTTKFYDVYFKKREGMERETLIENIKELRRKNNLSQSEMANKLHISLKTYQNIEYGVTKIDIDRLEKISVLLNVTWRDLLTTETTIPQDHNLYEKLLEERNRYIEKLEREILYYQKLLENKLYF